MNAGHHGSKSSLWNVISRAADECGVDLFDVDLPGGSEDGHGVLRVYITKPIEANAADGAAAVSEVAGSAPDLDGDEGSDGDGSSGRRGVTLDDCAQLSKLLLDIDERDGIIPDNCVLEVSSPGINRRLRRPEHFSGAVGERVRVKFRQPEGGSRVVTGLLRSATQETIEVVSEEKQDEVAITLNDIKEARVEFRF